MVHKHIVTFCGYNCYLRQHFYHDGSLALRLVTKDGEPLATATVCLSDYGYIPPPRHACIKNYAENEGILSALVASGAVEPTGDTVSVGCNRNRVHVVRVF